jgi:pimeloyl-ACP methyl ester carboxylesterase
MQVRLTQISTPHQKASTQEKAESQTAKEQPGDWFQPVRDLGVATRLLSLGQLYRWKNSAQIKEKRENPPLAAEASVKLDDPLVFIPGWTTTRAAFAPLAEKLLEGGRNGGQLVFVSQGKFFTDRTCRQELNQQQVQSDELKVFEMVYSDIRLPPDQSSQELAVNFKAIKELTGREKVDVNAFSMGGLATRVYLDKGGKDVDQVLFLGTPHQGTKFADLARKVLRRDIQWAVNLAGLLPADLPALDWLSPVEDGNPQLKKLNDRWPIQKAGVRDAKFIAGSGTMTSKAGWWPITDGDGLVPTGKAAPPGETAVVIKKPTHGALNNSAPVYREMAEFFDWRKDPTG